MSSLAGRREFYLKQKLSWKGKVDIMDPDTREGIGYFNRKVWSIRQHYRLYNNNDQLEMIIRSKISLKPTFKFYLGTPDEEIHEDQYIGRLRQKLLSFRPKYYFEDPEENQVFEIKGKFTGYKFKFIQDGDVVGEISKKFFKIRDTYGVRIDPGQSDLMTLVMLASVIMIHAQQENN